VSNYTRPIVAALVGAMLPLLGSSAPDSTAKVRIKPWNQQQLTTFQRSALEAFHGPDLRSKAGPMRKVGSELTRLFYLDLVSPPLAPSKLKANGYANLPLRETTDSRQFVLVDATANGDARLLRSGLQQLGAKDLYVYPPMVSGWVPVNALDQIAAMDSLRFLRPSRAMARTGAAISQGDFAIRGPSVRPPVMPNGPTGSGIAVGAISDSYDCLGGAASDSSNGEFPNGVSVIREEPGCTTGTDEGRAMLQIVADVAPNASLLFASGLGGIAAFANSVTSLAANGANIVVDDLWYFSSPWFQDGVITAAVNDAVLNLGAAYFSAAGNYATKSYESSFTPSAITGVNGGFVHDFDPSPGNERVFSSVFIPSGATMAIAMQWDQPAASACTGCPGSASDLDIYFFNGSVIGNPGIDFNIGADPVETASYTNPGADGVFTFVIEKFSGPDPDLIKLIFLDGDLSDIQDHTDGSTSAGPGLAANAMAVGAANFWETPACDTSPPQLASFSSRGGIPILFSATGALLATPVVRQKPEIVAPQGGNTSFFGQDIPDQPGASTLGECLDGDTLPNFPGTSASAPHAAGVAALLLDAIPSLTPEQLYDGMKQSAIDMLGAGFDLDSGFGLLQADTAFQRLADTTPAAFSFTPQTNIGPDDLVTSNAVTISDTNTGAPVSVSGGEFSVGCTATFTSASGTIQPNESVCVRHAASAAFNTAVTTTLTIGGVNGTFTSTTRVADTTPNAFSFVTQAGVAPNSVVTSNAVVISGIDAPTAIDVNSAVGEYSIGCTATFTNTASTISNGQTVCVRHTASSAFSTNQVTILLVGVVSGSFTSTTSAAPPPPPPPPPPSNGGGGGGGALGLTTLLPLLLLIRRRRFSART